MTAVGLGSAATVGSVLEAALRSGIGPGRGRAGLVTASIPIRPIDLVAAFGAARARGEPVALWIQPAAGHSFLAVGEAVRIDLAGPGRFERAAGAWRMLAAGAEPDPVKGGPVLVVGGPFADHESTDPIWRGLEAGRAVVPSLLVAVKGNRARLTATLAPDRGLDPADSLRELTACADGLVAPTIAVTRAGPPPRLRVSARHPGSAAWRRSVARAGGAVGRGRLDKVVLARRVDLVTDAPIDVPGVLRRLEAGAPGATTFAVTGADGRVFCGATPERLVAVRGRAFRTIALAGTVGRGATAADDRRMAAELLVSEKDREEHALVVDMLRSTLGPLAERIEVPAAPHVVRLGTVQHLATELSGTLRGGETILDLVERLHPTPAVGGWPTEAALALIGEEERIDRGWYAGPVGWLDASGDGEFVVAIRSGVIDAERASLFAGCGIVADSAPDREWDESELKLESLASAIGEVAE